MVSVGDRNSRPDTVKCRISERRGTLGYTNNKRKTLALLTAVATLAGGLTAGTAYAGGGGGNRPGTGGSGAATQFWQYKDDASGSWGLATDINSVSRAMANAGVRMDDSSGKAAAALADANSRCIAGFHQRHPGEGDGDCRVVAVGAASGNGSTTSVWKRVRRLRREDMEGQLVQEHRAK